jgi:hydrogenase maturation factor
MCLGELGTVTQTDTSGRAMVRFADGSVRQVSLAVLHVDGVRVVPGDVVTVSIGMALDVQPGTEQQEEMS